MTLDSILDGIYNDVDALARKGNFVSIDEMLDKVCASVMPEVLLAWLTATMPCKSKLKSRERIYKIAEATLSSEEIKGLE